MTDPYELLGLTPEASADEIREAYRKLAQQWHPDKHPDDVAGATRKFQELATAYGILADEAKRALYDDLGQLEPEKETALRAIAVQILARMSLHLLDADGDHVAHLRGMCGVDIAEQTKAIQDARIAIRKRERVARRWKQKLGGRNIFANAMRRDVQRLQQIIKTATNNIEITQECLLLLAEYEFLQDAEQRPATLSFRIPLFPPR